MTQPRLEKKGFTLIEMLVVVGLIAILSSLLIVGIGKLQTNAKRQQTVQLLENCRAMWAEYDSVNRLHIDQAPLPSPGNVTLEREVATEQQNAIGDRIGIDVIITRAIFSLMRSQPNIRAGMDKFPAGRMFLTTFATNPNAFSFITNNGVIYTPGTAYGVFSAVGYTDPATTVAQVYLCIRAVPTNSTGGPAQATPPPTDPGYWIPLQNETTDPVLLDAWGNPIICVLGGQLTGVNAGGRSNIYLTSPDKRMFWASAGPDGDFTKGDDNLYSFEKP